MGITKNLQGTFFRHIVILAILVIASGILTGTFWERAQDDPKIIISQQDFSGLQAFRYAEKQVELGPRIPGSNSHRITGDWIASTLVENGWATTIQAGEYKNVNIRNIIGKYGKGRPWIVLGAHYDSRIRADRDPVIANRDKPVPGANDGASGVAVLLEISRILSSELIHRGIPEIGEIWLVFFDWEDNGRIEGYDWVMGSEMFVQNLETYPDTAIILDMIGDSNLSIFQEENSNPVITAQIWKSAEKLGYDENFIPEKKYRILDDHIPFLNAGIPAVDIIDFDYQYWHTLSDTIDKISPESLEIVGQTILDWIIQYTSYK